MYSSSYSYIRLFAQFRSLDNESTSKKRHAQLITSFSSKSNHPEFSSLITKNASVDDRNANISTSSFSFRQVVQEEDEYQPVIFKEKPLRETLPWLMWRSAVNLLRQPAASTSKVYLTLFV